MNVGHLPVCNIELNPDMWTRSPIAIKFGVPWLPFTTASEILSHHPTRTRTPCLSVTGPFAVSYVKGQKVFRTKLLKFFDTKSWFRVLLVVPESMRNMRFHLHPFALLSMSSGPTTGISCSFVRFFSIHLCGWSGKLLRVLSTALGSPFWYIESRTATAFKAATPDFSSLHTRSMASATNSLSYNWLSFRI